MQWKHMVRFWIFSGWKQTFEFAEGLFELHDPVLLQCFQRQIGKKNPQFLHYYKTFLKGGWKTRYEPGKLMVWHEQRQKRREKERVNAHQLNTYWKSFSLPAFKLQFQRNYWKLGSDGSDGDKGFLSQYSSK